MKKRIMAWILIILMLVQIPVSAEEKDTASKASAVSAYGLENHLYTFAYMGDQYDGTLMKGRAENGTTGEEAMPELLLESDSTVRYVLMVDLSGSMKNDTNEVNEFIKGLMESEKKDAVYTVAAFGERFEIKAENMTDEKAVLESLNYLEYNEQITNPYDGIVNAIQYLNTCSRVGGELVNLILITDGEPDLGENQKQEDTQKKTALEKITSTPEVVLHTFSVSDWDKGASAVFSKGTGLHLEAKEDESTAKKAGSQVAEFVDGLYRTDFSLSGVPEGERFELQLNFTGQTKNGEYAVLEVEIPSVPVLRTASAGGEMVQDTTVAENPSTEESTSAEEASSETAETAIEEQEEKNVSGNKNQIIFYLAGGLAILVLLLFFAIWRRKRKDKSVPGEEKQEEGSVFIRLEVVFGHCKTQTREFDLRNELVIGSHPSCDIVFDEKSVSSRHCRIYRSDQTIYLEDLNSQNGTALGGMRIYAPNRLRSGDEILIGDAVFRFRF